MKAIHHVVDIDASREAVWASLTEPEGLAGWWSTKVSSPPAAVGALTHWTFAGDFNPVMETTKLEEGQEVVWRCVAGHEPWKDSLFRFQLGPHDDGHTRLRFWQDYAIELDDDAYGIYNFNWGYYLESLRLHCTTGQGKPFPAAE
jgi:uncharacterized protein YndB with AHSA1/START domain